MAAPSVSVDLGFLVLGSFFTHLEARHESCSPNRRVPEPGPAGSRVADRGRATGARQGAGRRPASAPGEADTRAGGRGAPGDALPGRHRRGVPEVADGLRREVA